MTYTYLSRALSSLSDSYALCTLMKISLFVSAFPLIHVEVGIETDISLLLHAYLLSPLELSDSPDQAAHYHILGF
jgi:hypothetical protein